MELLAVAIHFAYQIVARMRNIADAAVEIG